MTRTGASVHVQDVMTRDVVAVNPHDTLREALGLMVENRVAALPVVDGHERCVGILSVTDLLSMTQDLGDELNALAESGGLDHEMLIEKLEHAELLTDEVSSRMSGNVVTVRGEDSLRQAAEAILKNRVHRLVVVDAKQRLQGIVSTTDLLAAYVNNSPS